MIALYTYWYAHRFNRLILLVKKVFNSYIKVIGIPILKNRKKINFIYLYAFLVVCSENNNKTHRM